MLWFIHSSHINETRVDGTKIPVRLIRFQIHYAFFFSSSLLTCGAEQPFQFSFVVILLLSNLRISTSSLPSYTCHSYLKTPMYELLHYENYRFNWCEFYLRGCFQYETDFNFWVTNYIYILSFCLQLLWLKYTEPNEYFVILNEMWNKHVRYTLYIHTHARIYAFDTWFSRGHKVASSLLFVLLQNNIVLFILFNTK